MKFDSPKNASMPIPFSIYPVSHVLNKGKDVRRTAPETFVRCNSGRSGIAIRICLPNRNSSHHLLILPNVVKFADALSMHAHYPFFSTHNDNKNLMAADDDEDG